MISLKSLQANPLRRRNHHSAPTGQGGAGETEHALGISRIVLNRVPDDERGEVQCVLADVDQPGDLRGVLPGLHPDHQDHEIGGHFDLLAGELLLDRRGDVRGRAGAALVRRDLVGACSRCGGSGYERIGDGSVNAWGACEVCRPRSSIKLYRPPTTFVDSGTGQAVTVEHPQPTVAFHVPPAPASGGKACGTCGTVLCCDLPSLAMRCPRCNPAPENEPLKCNCDIYGLDGSDVCERPAPRSEEDR